MKSICCLFAFLLCLAPPAFSQNLSHLSKLKIYCKDFPVAKNKLIALTDSMGARIFESSEKNLESFQGRTMKTTIWCDPEKSREFEQGLESIGFVTDKEISTTTQTEVIEQLEMEIKFLSDRRKTFETEVANRPGMSEEKYGAFWEELRKIEERLFTLEKDLAAKKRQGMTSVFEIQLIEEIFTPTEETWQNVQFVNMPGFEGSYLWIENPLTGTSGKGYAGAQIKYLFTRGKSYIRFGVLRSLTTPTDTGKTQIKEIFLYSFGQDFYPRHFGRGRRAYLNLYTGYSVGGFFATADNFSRNIFFVMPHLGLELYKNRYVIFDSQAGYFIPFYANRNLRGLNGNVSFNFVF
ncbi:MAG: hypothetical protein KDC45_13400 [Bacteroidetes bacterium]|nr:hypothetical protein [Bacteroidota bacterium]